MVEAQWKSACLITKRLWVWILSWDLLFLFSFCHLSVIRQLCQPLRHRLVSSLLLHSKFNLMENTKILSFQEKSTRGRICCEWIRPSSRKFFPVWNTCHNSFMKNWHFKKRGLSQVEPLFSVPCHLIDRQLIDSQSVDKDKINYPTMEIVWDFQSLNLVRSGLFYGLIIPCRCPMFAHSCGDKDFFLLVNYR